jgi:hypothetical protein
MPASLVHIPIGTRLVSIKGIVLARRKPAQRGLSSGLSHGLDAALGGNTAPNISTGLGFSKRGIGGVGTKNTRPGWKRDLRDGCKVWVGVFQRSARAPRPDATTGFGLSKMRNLRCWTKNPARWRSRGGANEEVGAFASNAMLEPDSDQR